MNIIWEENSRLVLIIIQKHHIMDDNVEVPTSVLIMCFDCLMCSDLIYDLLSMLSKRLTEMDVSTILTILQCEFLLVFASFKL